MEAEEKIKELRKKQVADYLKEGENVYELFSVTVHTGGAFGGHYYVYIKSFEDSKWYCFNDTTVSPTTEGDVIKTYGELETAKCAYMLMYRRIGFPPIPITEENIPKYLREEIAQERAEEEKEEARRKEQLRRLTISVFFDKDVFMFPAYKEDTLLSLKQRVLIFHKKNIGD